jgi:hypothetical protein
MRWENGVKKRAFHLDLEGDCGLRTYQEFGA